MIIAKSRLQRKALDEFFLKDQSYSDEQLYLFAMKDQNIQIA